MAALCLMSGQELLGLVQKLLQSIREAGPVTFFACMALLPAVGVPVSLFSLSAGPAFAGQLGMPVVLVAASAALVANMALSHVLATRAMRPSLTRLLGMLGFRLPQARDGDHTDLVILLRVTPGVPFPVQNYLLGLAGVPFRRYLVISTICSLPITIAFILFGDAVAQGRGRMTLIAGLMVLAILVGARAIYRRRARPLRAG